jgi:hypothetical protein
LVEPNSPQTPRSSTIGGSLETAERRQ